MTLGERMLQYRSKHKLSQKQLGLLIDESLNTIFRCEKGDRMHLTNRMRIERKIESLEAQENE